MVGIRKTYDFNSVGESKEDFDKRSKNARDQATELPIGIKIPMEFGTSSDGLLKMHYNIGDAIADNFRNMIMTNHGERLGQYDFGGNLTELAFELGAEDTDTEAIRRIRRTTRKYMPFIALDTFEPLVERFDNKDVAKVGVRIGYRVTALSPDQRSVEVIIYTAG